MTRKERILKLDSEGLGPRAIARETGVSHPYVVQLLKKHKEQGGDSLASLLARLSRIVSSFAIEHEGHRWKVVNYILPLGAPTETGRHPDLRAAIQDAISIWG